MAASKYSFVIEQGSTIDFPMTYKNDYDIPVNLEGYSAILKITEEYNSTGSIATLTNVLNEDGTGLDMSNSLSGIINVYISSCSSSRFDFDQAYYQLDIMSPDIPCSKVSRVLEGKVKLSKSITQL